MRTRATGASTVVTASRRRAARPSRSRQPAARQDRPAVRRARHAASKREGPAPGDPDAAAPSTRPASAGTADSGGARRGRAGQRQAARVVGQLRQQLVQQGAHVAQPHEREQGAGGGRFVGVARDLHVQGGEAERRAEQALDDPDGADPVDGHRGLGALHEPAADAQPLAVAPDGEARERDERAERGQRPGDQQQRGGARIQPATVSGSRRSASCSSERVVHELLGDLPDAGAGPAG